VQSACHSESGTNFDLIFARKAHFRSSHTVIFLLLCHAHSLKAFFFPPNRLMTSHITLECDFKYGSLGYTCTSVNLNIISPNVTIMRVTGEHHLNTRNTEVRSFIVSRQNLKYIPENIAMFFRNLQSLTVYRSNLEHLRFTDFMGLYNLQKLIIQGNNLQFIDEDVFKVIPRLELLDLSDNHIAAIPFTLFSLSQSLRFLTLSNNLIRIFDILPFPVNCQLEELRLDGNQLVRINLATFMNAARVRQIDLHGNICINRSYPDDAGSVQALFTEIVHFCNTGVENGWIAEGRRVRFGIL
jgi:Leucine-rich repeat (LRR) protein